jgi:hypothetical protein
MSEELNQRLKAFNEAYAPRFMDQIPEVHASEFGAMLGADVPERVKMQGWKPVPEVGKREAALRAIYRSFGAERRLMSDALGKGGVFQKVQWSTPEGATTLEAIEGGIRFEEQFAARSSLVHTGGKLSSEYKLDYQVGGIRIRGEPDFIGYDEGAGGVGSFIIEDTKAPVLKKGRGGQIDEGATRGRAKSVRNYYQQLLYAYGLEKKAKELTPGEWQDYMRVGWGVPDEDMARKMQQAASGGRFQIKLRPGYASGDKYREMEPIDIRYGAQERMDIENAAKSLTGGLLSRKFRGLAAGDVYGALLDPKGVPVDLVGNYGRRPGMTPNMSEWRFLDEFAKATSRMAGGGTLGEEEQRIRVGEGGPEELIIKKSGEIKVVPTHELTESRRARGEDVSQEGYVGRRMNMGGSIFDTIGGEETQGGASPTPEFSMAELTTLVRELHQVVGGLTQSFGGFTEGMVQLVEQISGGITVKSAGGRAPSEERLAMESLRNIQRFGQGFGDIEGFQRGASDIMVEAFDAAGVSDVEGFRGGYNAANMFASAPMRGVRRETYMREFRRRGMLSQAKRVRGVGRAVLGFEQLARQGYDVAGHLIPGSEAEKVYQQYQSMIGAGLPAHEQASRMEQIRQATSVAEGVLEGASSPAMKEAGMAGATEATFKRYTDAVNAAAEATEKLAGTNTYAEAEEQKIIQLRETRRSTMEREQGRFEGLARQAPSFYDESRGFRRVSTDEVMRLRREVDPEELAAYTQAEQARESAMRARGVFERGGGLTRGQRALGRVGRISRRLLGGFGLMYMGSIANIIMGPGRMGYAESMEEQAVAEQAMGGRFAGAMPSLTPEARLQRARAMYGGYGARGMARLQAGLLEDRPGLAIGAGLLQAGVGGFGFTTFAAGLYGVGATAALPASLVAGGVAMGVMGASQLYGATAEPEQTAMELLARGGTRQFEEQGRLPTTWGGAALSIERFQTDLYKNPTYRWFMGPNLGEEPDTNIEDYLAKLEGVSDFMEKQGRGETSRGESVRDVLLRQGRTPAEASRLMSQYFQTVLPESGLDPRARAGAGAIMADYGLRIGVEAGGGLELLGSQLQAGVDLEALARMFANVPGAMPGERRTATAEYIEQFLGRGGLSAYEYARLSEGGQRAAALGVMQPSLRGGAQEQFFGALEAQGPDFQLFGMRMEQERRQRAYGLPYAPAEQLAGQYIGMTEEQRTAEMRIAPYRGLAGLTAEAQAQQGAAFGQRFIGAGMGADRAMQYARMLGGDTGMDARTAQMYMGMFGGDPRSFQRLASQNRALAFTLGGMNLPGMGGAQIPMSDFFMTDVNAQGQMTGLPWGTTSLGTQISTSQQMQGQIFGDPSTWAGQGFDPGLIGALTSGGRREAQRYQIGLQFSQQGAMAGIQRRQLALQREYQPQFWAIQDQQRQLGYAQQAWGFQMQQAQLDESQQYFQQTSGLQLQQMQMQRGWQVQDWAFQDRTRAMQWGWRQEDFGEQIRFMTGRERRMAERGMERETIMHDLEGEQIDKNRARQKDLWSLEDERFSIQMGHQNTLFDLQQENIDRQQEFFEERKRLETELTELQREYWEKNMQIQEDAIGINAAYAEQMKAIQLTMLELTEYTEDANARMSLFNQDSMLELANILEGLIPKFSELLDVFQEYNDVLPAPTTGGGGGGPGTHRQFGGRVYPGQTYSILEGGTPELFKPDMTGTIVPLDDPWGATVMSPGSGGGSEPIHIVLKVGDETLIDRMLDRVDQEIIL